MPLIGPPFDPNVFDDTVFDAELDGFIAATEQSDSASFAVMLRLALALHLIATFSIRTSFIRPAGRLQLARLPRPSKATPPRSRAR